MKKILFIVSFIGLSLTLQSCDRLSGVFGDDASQQEQVVDNQGQGTSEDIVKQDTDTTDKAATAKMQSQLQQNEDGIKKLNDSLTTLNSEVISLQDEVTTLRQKQQEIESDKVGVKNLFIYLTIFSIVVAVLVILLSKKVASKGHLTEKQVKDIIADFARRHPDIINESVKQTLNQHFGYIQNHKQAIDSINVQLGALANYVNGLSNGAGVANGTLNQQSWEKLATSGEQHGATGAQPNEASRIFYMKRPLNEMEFDLSLKRENPTEDTMYRFEIDRKRPNVAHFVFDCDSPNRVRWALNTKDKTLDRVCNASGSGTNGKYKCTAEGEAELRDGKWVVTRKAVVIFD